MATAITRSRRATIKKEAAGIRMRCQRERLDTEQTAAEIRRALPEVQQLEAWRLALGWSRSETITQVKALYVSDGLLPRSLSDPMLCRWEHDPRERPDREYTVMLCRAYGATPAQLGLGLTEQVFPERELSTVIRYGRPETDTCSAGAREMVVHMTTAAGLPAVRESLQLALLADPHGSAEVAELAEAAVEHYALTYPKHPPYLLFEEVRAARGLLTDCLVTGHVHEQFSGGLHRNVGWLSALMGNLAFHLDDHTGARAHLATATAYGTRTDDARLTAWALGAQSMVARAENRYENALAYAERAVAHAPAGLPKAQAHAWAQLTSLAGLGREQEADTALAAAARELETDPVGFAPGRFGFDAAEYTLHQAESAIALGHHNRARSAAETSIASTAVATPGWAAATLVLAQAEAPTQPTDAAQRALDVLARVPAARLRSTSRARLARLDQVLAGVPASGVGDLQERVRVLVPLIDNNGNAST
ncbi:Twin-arginine translocation pathway signal [Streptomyces sp. MB09-01]|uniref:Twin-arginine translocation pathway signal n=1 Tax=Streptomyces sp. MB09-01 TaxID=3028666 RepID=UPI0029BB96D4|nr:Twin-arginine translocation pathway signal [Streptomyces sp. MB09-01]MDX3540174.1 Twin-arginine translocation pathway signal [Streptomyces sp. MB09-01]